MRQARLKHHRAFCRCWMLLALFIAATIYAIHHTGETAHANYHENVQAVETMEAAVQRMREELETAARLHKIMENADHDAIRM